MDPIVKYFHRQHDEKNQIETEDDLETAYQVVIIGGGPAGLGVALELTKRCIEPVLLIERRDELGGVPARYRKKPGGVPTFIDWTSGCVRFGQDFAKRIVDQLDKTRIHVLLQSQVMKIDVEHKMLTLVNSQQGKFQISAPLIVMACGAREKNAAERAWIYGSRNRPFSYTNHLIEWIDRHETLPTRHPVILGSDLIAYSAAAKLRAAKSEGVYILDHTKRPQASLAERLYFRKWSRPNWRGNVQEAAVVDSPSSQKVTGGDGFEYECDGVVLSGELVPNSELALLGGLQVQLPERRPLLDSQQQFSIPGWYAAGNVLGGFHGAWWCYRNGRWLGRQLAKHIS